jgi:hypothetical protein
MEKYEPYFRFTPSFSLSCYVISFSLYVLFVLFCPFGISLFFPSSCVPYHGPMFAVSLDCSFFIARSVFSNVYLHHTWNWRNEFHSFNYNFMGRLFGVRFVLLLLLLLLLLNISVNTSGKINFWNIEICSFYTKLSQIPRLLQYWIVY